MRKILFFTAIASLLLCISCNNSLRSLTQQEISDVTFDFKLDNTSSTIKIDIHEFDNLNFTRCIYTLHMSDLSIPVVYTYGVIESNNEQYLIILKEYFGNNHYKPFISASIGYLDMRIVEEESLAMPTSFIQKEDQPQLVRRFKNIHFTNSSSEEFIKINAYLKYVYKKYMYTDILKIDSEIENNNEYLLHQNMKQEVKCNKKSM